MTGKYFVICHVTKTGLAKRECKDFSHCFERKDRYLRRKEPVRRSGVMEVLFRPFSGPVQLLLNDFHVTLSLPDTNRLLVKLGGR